MARIGLIHDRLTYSVIGAFFEVYHTLGFGFLEHVYVAALTRELHGRGHRVGREVSIPVLYKGQEFYRVICTKPVARAPKNPSPRVPPIPCGPCNPSAIVASGDEPQC